MMRYDRDTRPNLANARIMKAIELSNWFGQPVRSPFYQQSVISGDFYRECTLVASMSGRRKFRCTEGALY